MADEESRLTDQQLLDELVTSGAKLLRSAQQRLAALGDVADDPRWSAPLPISYNSQVPVLFLGALDAYDVASNLLRVRASQQAFNLLRFQMESLGLLRWMTEPSEAADRQHRAYRVACGQVRRFGKFMMQDAGRDKAALDGVRAVRDWGTRLREIAEEDGIPNLKGEPGRTELFKYADVAGYPSFSMFSELGSHPGTAGNTFFALSTDSDQIRYDPGGAINQRSVFASSAIIYLWKTCEVVSSAMAWDEWLSTEARPIYNGIAPQMAESLRRRRGPTEDHEGPWIRA